MHLSPHQKELELECADSLVTAAEGGADRASQIIARAEGDRLLSALHAASAGSRSALAVVAESVADELSETADLYLKSAAGYEIIKVALTGSATQRPRTELKCEP